jgi:hypothetical protein
MAGKAECRSCGAAIIWVKTQKGKNMPVDHKPEIENATEFDRATMVCHFETCPNAEQHRGKK